MKYAVNFNVVLLGSQDPTVLKQEIEKELSKESGKNIYSVHGLFSFLLFMY